MAERTSALVCTIVPARVSGAVAPARARLYTVIGTPWAASSMAASRLGPSCCSGDTGQ